ncbi:hypothetical protein DZA50_00635 [Kangiella sp. HD9-110m-PIT-SAG07]|nr:hypothetical protein DZA50_00635 [Kangiella sp. HD9-110m-PIT-SAG07]
MKRICPNCKNKTVYHKLLASHKYMKCQTCESLYTYSKTMHLAFLITYISAPILMYIFNPLFWPSFLPFIVMFIGVSIASILITQYLPLKQIANEDIAFTIPLKVDFEKADDVNTNIERYREAMKEAKEERLKEKTNKIFK